MLWAHTFQEASFALQRGEPDRAEELATQALEIGSASEEPDAFTYYGSQLMCARDQQGRLGELVDLIAEVAEQNPGMPVYGAILPLGPQRVRRRSNRPSALRRGRRTWLRPSPRQHVARRHDLLREHRCPAPPPRALRAISSLSSLRTTTRCPARGSCHESQWPCTSAAWPACSGVTMKLSAFSKRQTTSTSAAPCAMPRRRPTCGGERMLRRGRFRRCRAGPRSARHRPYDRCRSWLCPGRASGRRGAVEADLIPCQ